MSFLKKRKKKENLKEESHIRKLYPNKRESGMAVSINT
jgi:hypothetical protein